MNLNLSNENWKRNEIRKNYILSILFAMVVFYLFRDFVSYITPETKDELDVLIGGVTVLFSMIVGFPFIMTNLRLRYFYTMQGVLALLITIAYGMPVLKIVFIAYLVSNFFGFAVFIIKNIKVTRGKEYIRNHA